MNSPVEAYYSRDNLYDKILSLLEEEKKSTLNREDFAGVDEFHICGAKVSLELAREGDITENTKILDVGCGLGGACRMMADEFGCNVTGADITQEFIRTARLLSELLGLQEKTHFIQADALNLPFEDESFDVVWTQHAQMNIENKRKFYAEIKRVLRKGGKFIYYDVFGDDVASLYYPVPWTDEASSSFLISIAGIDRLLKDLGLVKIETRDHTSLGLEFFNNVIQKIKIEGPPKIGFHVLMGDNSLEKIMNQQRNLIEDKIHIQSGVYLKD